MYNDQIIAAHIINLVFMYRFSFAAKTKSWKGQGKRSAKLQYKKLSQLAFKSTGNHSAVKNAHTFITGQNIVISLYGSYKSKTRSLGFS